MSGASKQRTRQERIDSLGIQKPRLVQWWQDSDKADFATRIVVAVVAAIMLLALCQTWRPPFAYRREAIPKRDLITRVTFEVQNETETSAERERARRDEPAFYSKPASATRSASSGHLEIRFSRSWVPTSFDQLDEDQRNAFAQFFEGDETEPEDTPTKRFSMLKTVLADDPELKTLDEAIKTAMADNYRFGLIQSLDHPEEYGGKERIRVYPVGRPDEIEFVEASDVRTAQASDGISKRLREQFRQKFSGRE